MKVSGHQLNSMAKQVFINKLSELNIRGGYGDGDIVIAGRFRAKERLGTSLTTETSGEQKAQNLLLKSQLL